MLGIIALAVIQGIAEFLPISSSAHLIIFRDVFNIGTAITSDLELSFDIALHFGTLLAIVVYFFKDFLKILIKGFTKGIKDEDGKIMYFVLFASIPAALVGIFFKDSVEFIRNNLYVIAFALVFMGVLLYLVDKYSENNLEIKSMSLTSAFIIGISQAFALIPGFSRSGTTITTARLLKIKREEAAKFSFYLSAPVTFGAVLLDLMDKGTIDILSENINLFASGIVVSFLVGLFCISFLLKYLRKHDFKIFMIYRIILAIIVLIIIF